MKKSAVLIGLILLFLSIGSQASASYEDGIYSASSMGFGGQVTVKITIADRCITEVQATGPNETQAIGGRALDELPARIIAANGTQNVDAIAGATLTSRAVLQAANQCLVLAAMGATPSPTPTLSPVVTATPTPPPAIAHPEYRNGEYSAEAVGFGGTVHVQLSISNGWIIEVQATGPDETQAIGGRALDELPARIIAANGTQNVDAIAGATLTSRAVLQAANQCLVMAAMGATPSPTPTPSPVVTATPTPPPAIAHPEYRDGIFLGSASDFYGTVSVKLTILNGWIVDVIAQSGSPIGSAAVSRMPSRIVAMNGTDFVDTVAGATITSRAVLEAAEQCIEQSEDPSVPAHQSVVRIPAHIRQIEQEAFSNISAELIILPSACVQLESRAFADSQALRWIWIPSTVVQIADNAFDDCDLLHICTTANRAAHRYAEEHSIDCRLLPE